MSHKGFSHFGLSTLDLDATRHFPELCQRARGLLEIQLPAVPAVARSDRAAERRDVSRRPGRSRRRTERPAPS